MVLEINVRRSGGGGGGGGDGGGDGGGSGGGSGGKRGLEVFSLRSSLERS